MDIGRYARYALKKLLETCSQTHVPLELPRRIIDTIKRFIVQDRCKCPLPFLLVSHSAGLMSRILSRSFHDDILVEEKTFYEEVLKRVNYSGSTLCKMERYILQMESDLDNHEQHGFESNREASLGHVLLRMVQRAYWEHGGGMFKVAHSA